MPASLSTAAVHARERLSYWREVICDTYVGLDCDSAAPARFYGQVARTAAGRLHLSTVHSTTQHVRRTKRQIAKDTRNDLLLSIQTTGTGCIRQDGRDAHLSPGDMALYDSTRPYELIFNGDFSQFVVQLPRQCWQARLGSAHHATARRLDGASAVLRLMQPILLALHTTADQLGADTTHRLSESALDLLATAVCHHQGTTSNQPRLHDHHALLVLRAKAYIDDMLHDPDLSPDHVAHFVGISQRHLNRLFASDGLTLQRYIQQQRLTRARTCLRNRAFASETIGQIAYRCGFRNQSHFTAAFKHAFGYAPRAVRNMPDDREASF